MVELVGLVGLGARRLRWHETHVEEEERQEEEGEQEEGEEEEA